MNVALTDIEILMLIEAVESVWWSDRLRRDRSGNTEAAKAIRIERKLKRALAHTNTEFE